MVIGDANGAESIAAAIVAVLWLLLILALYMIPTIIARVRKVPNVGSVTVINLFLGWTFIGWVVALAMASRSGDRATVVNQYAVAQSPHVPSAPPGWFADPSGRHQQRYWDGSSWTPHVRSDGVPSEDRA